MGLILLKLVVLGACVARGDARRLAAGRGDTAAGRNDTADNDTPENNPLSECHYSDPAVSACIERVATAARGVLARGVPALGVQPLEPLRVPSIRLRQHNVPTRSFKYDAWLTDVAIHGLTDYSFNRLDDPAVSACIERVATAARGVLARGVPALGVQPLEPLRVPSIRLRQHNVPTRSFKYDAWLTDVAIHGLTDYSFNRLDVYPEELKVTTNISLPLLAMFSEYVILGEFQMLPVESTGKMSVNFTQCTAALEAMGARAHKRLVVRDAAVRLRCAGPLRADLIEAHSTTSEMEMITEHIARMHAGDIAGEVQPALETALAMVLEDVANKFLKHLPAESVFPN